MNDKSSKPASSAASTPLFREEALRHFASSQQAGALLALPNRWLHAVLWLLAALVIVAVAFARFGSVPTYVPGRGAYVAQPDGSLMFVARLAPSMTGQGPPPIGSRLLLRRESGPAISLRIDRVGSSGVTTSPWPCGALLENDPQVLAVALADPSHHHPPDTACHDVSVQSGRRSLWAVVRERFLR